jgi:hypothetical protein
MADPLLKLPNLKDIFASVLADVPNPYLQVSLSPKNKDVFTHKKDEST